MGHIRTTWPNNLVLMKFMSYKEKVKIKLTVAEIERKMAQRLRNLIQTKVSGYFFLKRRIPGIHAELIQKFNMTD